MRSNLRSAVYKAIDLTSPKTSSGQASRPYETVPIGTISSPSEGGRKPQGENNQALAVKGERHPTCGLELNPGRSGERRTCYHGATKPLPYHLLACIVQSFDATDSFQDTRISRSVRNTYDSLLLNGPKIPFY